MDAPTVMVSSRSGRAAASALMAKSSARMNATGDANRMQTESGMMVTLGQPPLVPPRLLGSGGSLCSVPDQGIKLAFCKTL